MSLSPMSGVPMGRLRELPVESTGVRRSCIAESSRLGNIQTRVPVSTSKVDAGILMSVAKLLNELFSGGGPCMKTPSGVERHGAVFIKTIRLSMDEPADESLRFEAETGHIESRLSAREQEEQIRSARPEIVPSRPC